MSSRDFKGQRYCDFAYLHMTIQHKSRVKTDKLLYKKPFEYNFDLKNCFSASFLHTNCYICMAEIWPNPKLIFIDFNPYTIIYGKVTKEAALRYHSEGRPGKDRSRSHQTV